MLIWYFTAKNWFKNAILVPVGMLFYQIIFLLDEEIKFQDEFILDKYIVFPLSCGICIFLLVIRSKLIFYADGLDLKEEIEAKIKEIQFELAEENESQLAK